MDYKTLSEIATNFRYGKMPDKSKISDSGDYPVWSGYRYVGYYDEKNVNKDEIVVVARGVGGTGDVKICREDCFLTNLSIAFKVNEDINPLYVYYFYQIKNLRYLDSGSAQSQITINDLKNVKIPIPNKNIQDKIVEVLNTIDQKIELNNQINNNLHELINQQYSKYLKENDDFEELDIKDIFEFEAGVEPGSKNYLENIESDTIYFYRVGDMNSECRTFIKRDLAKGKYITENDIVVSFDATIGRIGYGLNGSYSTGMKKVSVKDKYKDVMDNSIVYAYFNNNEVQNIMKENARGTTILHASSSIDFMKFKYNKLLLKKYSRIISISFEKMKNIKKENEKLLELRDVLLPKLMNGAIDLDNIEI